MTSSLGCLEFGYVCKRMWGKDYQAGEPFSVKGLEARLKSFIFVPQGAIYGFYQRNNLIRALLQKAWSACGV